MGLWTKKGGGKRKEKEKKRKKRIRVVVLDAACFPSSLSAGKAHEPAGYGYPSPSEISRSRY